MMESFSGDGLKEAVNEQAKSAHHRVLSLVLSRHSGLFPRCGNL
jgi:hypothetical protein